MFHELLKIWFERLQDWGYPGVFLLMAIESTIVPIPSEVIMPPAAYWAAQGHFNVWLLVLVGALGSTFGSSLCYGFMLVAGRPFVLNYGRYFFLPPEKFELAERFLADFALGGIFFARLLPVLRHLIGFPAGLIRVPFWQFVLTTFAGSFVWCGVLAYVGINTIGKSPDLLQDPDALGRVLKHDTLWFVGLAAIVGAGFMFVKWYGRRSKKPANA
jgi:membrane protein DedA with SNARE-associated domain